MSRPGMLKVLVVDDDPIVLEVIGEMILRRGCEVYRRERALGTVSWILRERPDMVVVDINMPGLAGDSILDIARQRLGDRCPSFVLMSSMPNPELEALCQTSGALGYLQKREPSETLEARFAMLSARHRRLHATNALRRASRRG